MYSLLQPNNSLDDTLRLMRAIGDSARWHAGALRKGTNTPYHAHPFGAMTLLMTQDVRDEDILIAALLHDCIEDTDCTLAIIERAYGRRVAKIVEGLTEPDKSLSWEARKLHTLDNLRSQPQEVKLVALADKLHNLISLCEDLRGSGEGLWERFNRGLPYQRWYYYRLVQSFSQDPMMAQHPMVQQLQSVAGWLFQLPAFAMPQFRLATCPSILEAGEEIIALGEGFLNKDIPYCSGTIESHLGMRKVFFMAKDAVAGFGREGLLQLMEAGGVLRRGGTPMQVSFGLHSDNEGMPCLSIAVKLSVAGHVFCSGSDLIELQLV